jgi:hypothetical protein
VGIHQKRQRLRLRRPQRGRALQRPHRVGGPSLGHVEARQIQERGDLLRRGGDRGLELALGEIQLALLHVQPDEQRAG